MTPADADSALTIAHGMPFRNVILVLRWPKLWASHEKALIMAGHRWRVNRQIEPASQTTGRFGASPLRHGTAGIGQLPGRSGCVAERLTVGGGDWRGRRNERCERPAARTAADRRQDATNRRRHGGGIVGQDGRTVQGPRQTTGAAQHRRRGNEL
jgi:hypothetical protein